ncbi:MAG: AMP-binding protein [Pseudomonadota bacterium]
MLNPVDQALVTPDKPAFVLADTGFTESYAELEKRSRDIAFAFRAAGLRRGDCVAILLDNCEQFFDIYWATQRIGLYLVPINWHLGAIEIRYILENSGASLLISSAAVASATSAAENAPPAVKHFWSVGGELPEYDSLGSITDALCNNGELPDQRPGSVMIYSSGTTGFPKGIRKSLPNGLFRDASFAETQTRFIKLFGFQEGDRYLCPAPLYHAAPMRSCTATQCLGGTVYAMTRFDARRALSIIEQYSIQVSQWVPTHFKRLLYLSTNERAEYDLGSLRVAVHAAAPCPIPIKQAMIDWWGPILTEYYAGTEGGGTLIRSAEWLLHEGSVGKPWKGVDLAILGPDGELDTDASSEGAIYFCDRLGERFTYHGDDAKTRAAYRNEWFTLGDIGFIDNDGYLYLTDRQSNMIISGGVNIYPQEAENCLMAHPQVYDVAVIGVPDDDMGEQVKAVVIPASECYQADDLEHTLIEHCKQHLASFKVPRSIDFVATLPRTETGKLVKRTLRERYRNAAQ